MKHLYEDIMLMIFNFIDNFGKDEKYIRFKIVCIVLLFLLGAWLEQKWTI